MLASSRSHMAYEHIDVGLKSCYRHEAWILPSVRMARNDAEVKLCTEHHVDMQDGQPRIRAVSDEFCS